MYHSLLLPCPWAPWLLAEGGEPIFFPLGFEGRTEGSLGQEMALCHPPCQLFPLTCVSLPVNRPRPAEISTGWEKAGAGRANFSLRETIASACLCPPRCLAHVQAPGFRWPGLEGGSYMQETPSPVPSAEAGSPPHVCPCPSVVAA